MYEHRGIWREHHQFMKETSDYAIIYYTITVLILLQ